MKPRSKRPVRPMPGGLTGTLPAQAPLANPYVPFQDPTPPKYEARKALIRGTLYPGLDLPFLGMVNDQLKPDTQLNQLRTVNFAVQELALYLDTHREDGEALELYRSYLGTLQEQLGSFLIELTAGELEPTEQAGTAHGAHDNAVLDLHIAYLPGGK